MAYSTVRLGFPLGITATVPVRSPTAIRWPVGSTASRLIEADSGCPILVGCGY